MTRFAEVADGVHVLRYPVLDVNVTLIVGDGTALVVDTLSTEAQANEVIAEIRRITSAALLVVNTHHHFDHCFGNDTFVRAGRAGAPDRAGAANRAGTAVWGHESVAALLRTRGAAMRHRLRTEWAAHDPVLAEGLASVTIHPPDHPVRSEARLDVGGRPVVLRHCGRGHTDGDLVVVVPDAHVMVLGDLLEESGPPQFDDGYPISWPETLAAVLALAPPTTRLVPGHGAVVDPAFAEAQHADLASLGWLIREGHADGAPIEAVAARAVATGMRSRVTGSATGQSTFDGPAATVAVRRGYAELSGA